jgi:peptidoglycan lytic transglycosylase
MGGKKTRGCQMAIRQAVQLLGLAGATLAGCVQHTVTERSASLGVSPQASPAPERRASVAHHRRLAAAPRKHTPFAARPAAAKPAATTDGSVGIASFYKYDSKTASGEQFNPSDLTAAHRTLPFGTRLRVTNVATGQTVTVRVNDRGPFIAGRVVDVSHSAAEVLGMVDRGITKVKLEVEKP